MYAILGIINLIIAGFLFYKDPVLATALFIGGAIALMVSGMISLADHVLKTTKKN